MSAILSYVVFTAVVILLGGRMGAQLEGPEC